MVNTENRLFSYFGTRIAEEKTIRQISIEASIPYMTLSRIVKKMEKMNMLKTRKAGKSILCKLNISNQLTKQYLIIASESSKNQIIEKKPIIRKIAESITDAKDISAVLFGSYAEGKEQRHSDIDLAFITDKKSDAKNIQDCLKAIEQIHEIEINTLTFTKRQFKDMLTAKEENVGKQILNKHIILCNPELFWNIVYGALQ